MGNFLCQRERTLDCVCVIGGNFMAFHSALDYNDLHFNKLASVLFIYPILFFFCSSNTSMLLNGQSYDSLL